MMLNLINRLAPYTLGLDGWTVEERMLLDGLDPYWRTTLTRNLDPNYAEASGYLCYLTDLVDAETRPLLGIKGCDTMDAMARSG